MYLSRLEIENFRGVRSARLDFGDTTVVIGENDSGKTTLLEAVCLVLSPIPDDRPIVFSYQDFYMQAGEEGYRNVGPVSIRLAFRERRPDEWSFLKNTDFGFSLADKPGLIQEFVLEIKADPVREGEESKAKWRIMTGGQQQMDFSDDKAILSWIRRLNPVYRIKSGILANLSYEAVDRLAKARQTGEVQEADELLGEKIRQSYMNLISGTTQDQDKELQAGYGAAMQYLGQVSNLFTKEGPAMEQIIYEILGKRSPEKEFPRKQVVLSHGSAAEKIGTLLFTAAFLQSGSFLADPSAEPILIIEDPESHLHPMTLESVNLVIGRLKWQKIITTQSGILLSGFPLENIRRISRHEGMIRQHWVRPGDLSSEEMRRLSYHVRMRLSTATFARCWLLVEGESEIWLLPHLARLCGYDFSLEGVVCVEFAQCGIPPLIKAASLLGIEWYLLADGDAAGKSYIETARSFAREQGLLLEDHSMRLRERDIEHNLFFNGYAEVYEAYAEIPRQASENMPARRIIERAIHRNSKPFMAVAIVEAIARKDSPGVPSQLKKTVETCVRLANEAK